MEVHAHSHTERKKWTHYLWEFLMLFLAVSAGFFVENLREHFVEHQREKQFILSFAGDLKKDIDQLDTRIMQRKRQQLQMDSLTEMLNSPDPDQYGSQVYFFARYLPRPYVFYNNDATMQQLKNAGNLRLIRKQAVVDTIMAYDQQFRFIDHIQAREDMLVQRIFNHLNILFDSKIFDNMILNDIEFARPEGNPPLRSKNKPDIQAFLSDVHYLKTVNNALIGNFIRQRDRAKTSLAFISKEYHLK